LFEDDAAASFLFIFSIKVVLICETARTYTTFSL
jgi:hypothetical protein